MTSGECCRYHSKYQERSKGFLNRASPEAAAQPGEIGVQHPTLVVDHCAIESCSCHLSIQCPHWVWAMLAGPRELRVVNEGRDYTYQLESKELYADMDSILNESFDSAELGGGKIRWSILLTNTSGAICDYL